MLLSLETMLLKFVHERTQHFSSDLMYMLALNISPRMFLFCARSLRFVFQRISCIIFVCLSRDREYKWWNNYELYCNVWVKTYFLFNLEWTCAGRFWGRSPTSILTHYNIAWHLNCNTELSSRVTFTPIVAAHTNVSNTLSA